MSAPDIEIGVEVKRETSMALLVFDGKVEAWIPKSQISDECVVNGKLETIFIPEWLALEKGLI